MDNITLSDGEWKLMNALWDNAPCSLAQLVKVLDEETGWSKSTIFVMLKRLTAKEAVCVDDGGRIQMYSPLIKKSEAVERETESFLSRVYDGSLGMMVSSIAGQHNLSQDDIAQLRKILDEAESSLNAGKE